MPVTEIIEEFENSYRVISAEATKAFTRLFGARNELFREIFRVSWQDTVWSALTNTSCGRRMYSRRENIANLHGDFVICEVNYSLLLNLENFESDFCWRSVPEAGHVVLSHDD